MKIPGQIPSVYSKQAIKPGQEVEQAQGKQIKGPKGDQVDISSRAREMQAAQEAVRQMPDVDIDKVETIRAQLKNGTYKVESDKIAAKMIEESLLNPKDQR